MSIGNVLTRVFGSRNDRLIKRYRKMVAQINALEPQIVKLTDQQLRDRTQDLRAQILAGKVKLADILPEAMAIIRESMDRNIGMRNVFNPEFKFDPELFPQNDNVAFNKFADIEDQLLAGQVEWQHVAIPNEVYDAVRRLYPESRPPFRARCFDVQLIGGLVLYEGKIAEMKTGEGKTFVAPLACFLKVLEGFHAHVITVNDYLVKRDATWTAPAFEKLGLTVGYLQSTIEPWGEGAKLRKAAYSCNVTYGTNSEFGFDYLRDNMKATLSEQVQGTLDYAIVDEVDSVLIDEARTPLIISGEAHDNTPRYRAADEVARKLIELHKPAAAIEKEILSAKRDIKAAEGDLDKAETKEGKVAAQSRIEEARQRLINHETRKAGVTSYYEVEYDRKSIRMTHEGIASAQEMAGVGSFYVGDNLDWPHLMEQALRAHVVYEKDKDYVVELNPKTRQQEVVIVDEYTGRKMVGRQWSDGLHQACEAKERVTIKKETQTMATVTLQNFFKLYRQISGMTGTAQTEAEEFNKIYKLEVVSIPTNRAVARLDYDDKVYRTEPEKWEAMLEEIKAYSDAGRPVLVGTTSVEKSERLSTLLGRKYGIKHEVLNAKQHEREANIVAVAGHTHKNAQGEVVGNVTIATNMAGRGTDIKLAAETQWDVAEVAADASDRKTLVYTLKRRGMDEIKQVRSTDPLAVVLQLQPTSKSAGGLHVIGTERHTSRRIDNQLRGRSGRQGDPGSSRFYCSLEDDLLKLFMPEWTVNVFKRIGMAYGEAIESGMLTKSIERAQKKVEERNYLARKNLLEYDEVMDVQRNEFYTMRQRVLEGRDIDQVIWKMIGEAIEDAVNKYIVEDYVSSVIAEWARTEFDVPFEANDFRGIRRFNDLDELVKSIARNEIVTTIPQTLGEYLGEDRADPSQWHIKDLTNWARQKYGVIFTESELRQMDAGEVEERLKVGGLAQIKRHDVSGLLRFIEPHYAAKELCNWAEEKFNIEVDPEELILDAGRNLMKPAEEIIELLSDRAQKSYRRREIEYPIDHTMASVFGPEAVAAENAYGVEYLRGWARSKFGVEVSPEDVTGKPITALRAMFLPYQEKALSDAAVDAETDKLLADPDHSPEALSKRWAQRFGFLIDPKLLDPAYAGSIKGKRTADEETVVDVRTLVRHQVRGWVRSELTQLEQYVLISIFDQSWKDHLYAMDMLKGSIGLQGFAEKDPRVAYKREGYRFFREMMMAIRDKVTGMIFRVYVGGKEKQKPQSNYNTTSQSGPSEDPNYDVAANTQQTSDALKSTASTDSAPQPTATITRDALKLGRNDTCPQGTGQKYKRCCGKFRDDGVCDGSGKKA
jgi:preprotein translocase subunit SecA